MSKGSLFVISGPSGTGKGTVCEELLKNEPIFLSVSSTTRDRRNNEVDGVTYNYISAEEFEKLIKDGETGILVNEPTPEGLATALRRALENGEYYDLLIQKCKKAKESILSVEEYADILIEKYKKLIAR